MLASVIIAGFTYIFTAPEDHGAFDTFVLILKATAAGLGVMGLWHLIRTPWLAERDRGKEPEHHWVSAVFGLLIVVGIVIGGIWGIFVLYREHKSLWSKNHKLVEENKRIAEENETIKKRPPEVQYVTKEQPQESPNSLRRRTIKLINDLVLFWSQRPQPVQQPVQNPTTDEERQRNAKWDRYWREVGAAYANAGFRERVLGIVRQYRAKGLDVGFLEQAAEQPERLVGAYSFGGTDLNGCSRYMTELCQLRELAYHVDGNDDMIILGPKPQTPQ